MALSTTYSDIYSLTPASFIGGSTYTFRFTVLDQSGSAVDLSDASIHMKFAPYGTDYVQINKTASLVTTNIFEVILAPSDTAGLSGKYTIQPIITFSNGVVLIPGQGILTISKGLA